MQSYRAQTVRRILTTGRQAARRQFVDTTWQLQSNKFRKQLESLVHYFCQPIKARTTIFRDASHNTNEEDLIFLLCVLQKRAPELLPPSGF